MDVVSFVQYKWNYTSLMCQKEKEIVHFKPHGDFQNEKYEEQFQLSLQGWWPPTPSFTIVKQLLKVKVWCTRPKWTFQSLFTTKWWNATEG